MWKGLLSGTTTCIIAHTGSSCEVPDAEKGEANTARVLLSVRVSPARDGTIGVRRSGAPDLA